ncbi:MAG: four helix bundle protein [Patescibacteria group bacterium]
MPIKRFEDIIAWQKAKTLTLMVYHAFAQSQERSFKDQVQRAALSVMNNIAEGYERRTNKDFKNFLYIAKGSCGEVRSITYIAKDLRIITSTTYEEIHSLSTEISRLLSGFIKKL